jgi:GntR family transcriptional repressor for pyruvate dehydrogenase complex
LAAGGAIVATLATTSGSREPVRRHFDPVRPTRSFETAIVSILEGVERNRLRRGDRLPTERHLAAELGISIPTLRQALVVLQRSGVVDVRPGKAGGIFLTSDLIPTEAVSEAVALEEDAAIDVLRARRVLEPAVATYTMHVAAEDDWAELERTVELLASHLGERAPVMRADAMFHRALVRASQNRTLQTAMHAIAKGLAPIRDAYSGGIERDRETLEIHASQLEAMRERDEAALAVTMDRHLRQLEELFAAAIGRSWDDVFATGATRALELPSVGA